MNEPIKNTKPLGGKAYGSTPHLPGSRVGPGDHHCHEGQERICTTRARDKHDRVIVTEKLDGSNVAVLKKGGAVLSLTRAGYLADTSPYAQHHYFARWVDQNTSRFDGMLAEGEMINGEWLALAHGTRYELPHDPFVAFSLGIGKTRHPWDEVAGRCKDFDVVLPRILSDGAPISVEAVRELIETSGHGAIDPVEGAVWRVESRGQYDFLAKWVSPDKQDGKYLNDITGHPEIWHWAPSPRQKAEA
jgi:hypothetical protein